MRAGNNGAPMRAKGARGLREVYADAPWLQQRSMCTDHPTVQSTRELSFLNKLKVILMAHDFCHLYYSLVSQLPQAEPLMSVSFACTTRGVHPTLLSFTVGRHNTPRTCRHQACALMPQISRKYVCYSHREGGLLSPSKKRIENCLYTSWVRCIMQLLGCVHARCSVCNNELISDKSSCSLESA